jgi:hypothetical protein
MERPEHDIVALGAYTTGLLNDTTYNELFKEYTDQSLSAIINSAPHEVKVREFEYAKMQALLGFNTFLAGFATAAQNIINKDANNQSDED